MGVIKNGADIWIPSSVKPTKMECEMYLFEGMNALDCDKQEHWIILVYGTVRKIFIDFEWQRKHFSNTKWSTH